jgi:hypothetical protein
MKLGTDTGSLINHLASRSAMPRPEVGMGATILMWSDRLAATIIWVSPSGKTIKLQHDTARRTDARGYYTEDQDYEYSRDPGGRIETARLTKRGWRLAGGGPGVLIGHREEYRDPTF